MTDITIPPEAAEAAARAICETENGPCKCMPDECGCIYWLAHARASIVAALQAWPGGKENKVQVPDDSDEIRYTLKTTGIILPLTTENTNAEG